MSLWSFIKELATTVFENIVKVVETLTEEKVHVTEDGTIIVEEPLFSALGNKLTAGLLAAAGLLMLFLPFSNAYFMTVGDSLIRAATNMWNGEGWTKTA